MPLLLQRNTRPRLHNYRTRRGVWSGLGDTPLSYYDLLAQANLQNCDPRDSACVSNNVAKQAAVEDLWVNRFEGSGAPAGTQLSFTPQTPQQVAEFYNPGNPFNNPGVVDTRGIMQVSGPSGGQGAPAPVVAPKAPTPPGGTQKTQQQIANDAPTKGSDAGLSTLSASFNCVDPTTCWFGFPKWFVLVAGGAALLMLGGSHGR